MQAPKHRKNGRITLEEFRQHRSDGISIREMPKLLKASKHHIQFLSALDQNKYSHITKEMFKSDYLSGKSLFEMADEYGIPKDYIGFLREHLEINRLGPKFIHRKKTEKPLTDRQKKLVYGSLMGDAGYMSSSSVKMKQSTKQREFLLWKFNELQEHVSLKSLQEESYHDKRYDTTYTNVRFYTNANTDIETILTCFYKSGKKTITADILNNLTEFSIAVWYMDDGTVDWKRRQIDAGLNANPAAFLCTDSFHLDEIKMMCEWFKNKWSITCKPKHRGGEKYRIFFPTTETPKLFALIRPFIIPPMLYKVDYQAYVKEYTSH